MIFTMPALARSDCGASRRRIQSTGNRRQPGRECDRIRRWGAENFFESKQGNGPGAYPENI